MVLYNLFVHSSLTNQNERMGTRVERELVTQGETSGWKGRFITGGHYFRYLRQREATI